MVISQQFQFEKSDVAFQSAITAGEWFTDIHSQNNGNLSQGDIMTKITIQSLITSFAWAQELLEQGIQPSKKFSEAFFKTKGDISKVFNPK